MSAGTTRRERREEYKKVLRIIEHNTGGKQPALLSTSGVYVVASSAGMDRDHVRDRLQAARENGDVLEWHGKVALTTEEGLRDVIREENQADHPRTQLIERCGDLLGWPAKTTVQEVADAE